MPERGETVPNETFAMLTWQRRIVLALLGSVWALLASADFGHQRPPSIDWAEIWCGCNLLALPTLLAVWAALSPQPLAVRWPRTVGAAACLGLSVRWHSLSVGNQFPAWAWIVFFVVAVSIQAVILTFVQRRAGWQIHLAAEAVAAEAEAWQFCLRQMLLWTVTIAVLLSLTRWMGLLGLNHADHWRLSDLLLTGIVASTGLPLVWAVVRSRLADGDRRHSIGGTVGMGGFSFLLFFVLIAAISGLQGGPKCWNSFSDFQGTVKSVCTMFFPFAFTVLATFQVLRLCGYRLIQTKVPQTDTPLAVELPLRRNRVAFLYLAGTLGLLTIILIGLAWRSTQIRIDAIADQREEERFQELGVSARLHRRELVRVCFRRKQPIPKTAFAMLQECSDRGTIGTIELPEQNLTVEQIHCLSQLRVHVLILTGCNIDDAALAQLTTLSELNGLDLSETQVSSKGLKSLQAFPELEILYLNKLPLGDEDVTRLVDLPRLAWLELNNTQVSDEGLKSLQTLPELQILQLNNTRVSDVGLKSLLRLKRLRMLDVGGTFVTRGGLTEFARELPRCSLTPRIAGPGTFCRRYFFSQGRMMREVEDL